ncbi:hypothetical protein GGTG_06560 [Gaeumannomyces tritici R3-111a-1]|uniref:Uncharacterized protein n=1 Tax=Gaeumannomyces tritici (strain R3-111a-1) TaxID=644352 RepID=J3NZ60_GAET3|nr:hypothetical protein GGTG_06560 [Gaeumannomyces tritici R3-111a-1]EJT76643.1 hypothetical protein GGTG_06560 [Gaeumannomyces tritici R3-111a-1]
MGDQKTDGCIPVAASATPYCTGDTTFHSAEPGSPTVHFILLRAVAALRSIGRDGKFSAPKYQQQQQQLQHHKTAKNQPLLHQPPPLDVWDRPTWSQQLFAPAQYRTGRRQHPPRDRPDQARQSASGGQRKRKSG